MTHDEVSVAVSIGRDSLSASVSTLEVLAGEPVAVVLDNEGTPVHAHCRLGGDLAELTALEQSNHYVEADSETRIQITVPDVDQAVDGTLEISTGYGANSVTIDVTVTTGPEPIAVDERLGEPNRKESEPSVLSTLAGGLGVDLATLAVLALGVVAVGVAVTTAAIVGGGPEATFGVLVVGIGVLVALWLLVTG